MVAESLFCRRKKAAREVHEKARFARKVRGIKAKLYNKQRYKEKATLRKKYADYTHLGDIIFICCLTLFFRIKVKTEKDVEHSAPPSEDALPAYLLDREEVTRSKVLSNTLKQLRKEKAGKWSMPIQSVRPIADQEMFRVLRSGKRKSLFYIFVIFFCYLIIKFVIILNICIII